MRWESSDSAAAEDYTSFYGEGNANRGLDAGFFVCNKVSSYEG